MNNRWERNLPNIIALEKKVEELHKQIEAVESNEEKENILISIEDYNSEIEGLKTSFEELIRETRSDLNVLYLNDKEGDWTVAWSGGKDSTTVAGLVIDMLLDLDESQRKRNVHFVMSDTVVENPNLESYMLGQIKKLKDYAEKSNLPITVNLVQRPVKESYFYLILGRGYFLPQNNGRGRWCTHRLKTKPQFKMLEEIAPIYQLTGVRLSESAMRKASIKKWTIDSRLNKKIGGTEKMKTFMAIVNFTIEDVWEYLQRERLPWSSTHEVRTLYREATGECGFTNPKGTEIKASQSESCGARFGCWICPVILKDRSTEAMSQHNDWMKPLTEFRLMQIKVMGDYKPIKPEEQKRKARSHVLKEAKLIGNEIKKITKSGYKRRGTRYTDSDGVIHNDKGTLTVEARKYLFNKLIETENEVNYLRMKSGLETIKLISDEEITLIKEMWEEDEEQAKWLITNVNDIPIEKLDYWIDKLNDLEINQPLDI